MFRRPQIAWFWLAALLAAGIALPATGQRRGSEHWQQREDKPHGKQQGSRSNKPNRPPKQGRPANRPPRNEAHVPPPNATVNRSSETGEPRSSQDRANKGGINTGSGVPPRWMERLREMSPPQQERFLQNNQRFNSLSPQQQDQMRRTLQHWNSLTPQQRMDMRDREQVWARMTPEQRGHVRNDVLPKWQQMPPERKQAIQQKLRVLQNMPESARNERLNDPNFTRGMSEEDKSMLRDLSHLHVGGAPEPPQENPPE